MRSNWHVSWRIQLNLSDFVLPQGFFFIWILKYITPKDKNAVTGYEISILNRATNKKDGTKQCVQRSRKSPTVRAWDTVEERRACEVAHLHWVKTWRLLECLLRHWEQQYNSSSKDSLFKAGSGNPPGKKGSLKRVRKKTPQEVI